MTTQITIAYKILIAITSHTNNNDHINNGLVKSGLAGANTMATLLSLNPTNSGCMAISL